MALVRPQEIHFTASLSTRLASLLGVHKYLFVLDSIDQWSSFWDENWCSMKGVGD